MLGTVTTIIRKQEGRTQDRGGYFFIHDSEGRDRFAHARDLTGTSFDDLREGMAVEFEPTSNNRGRRGGGNGLRGECVKVIRDSTE